MYKGPAAQRFSHIVKISSLRPNASVEVSREHVRAISGQISLCAHGCAALNPCLESDPMVESEGINKWVLPNETSRGRGSNAF